MNSCYLVPSSGQYVHLHIALLVEVSQELEVQSHQRLFKMRVCAFLVHNNMSIIWQKLFNVFVRPDGCIISAAWRLNLYFSSKTVEDLSESLLSLCCCDPVGTQSIWDRCQTNLSQRGMKFFPDPCLKSSRKPWIVINSHDLINMSHN